MQDLDKMIDEALESEERELLRSIGEEPPYIAQLMGLFDGKTGWLNAIMLVVQTVLFVIGAWMAWTFFGTSDTLSALHWGIPAAVLLLMSLIIKLAMWPTIQANRLMRELKLIQLQIARGAKS